MSSKEITISQTEFPPCSKHNENGQFDTLFKGTLKRIFRSISFKQHASQSPSMQRGNSLHSLYPRSGNTNEIQEKIKEMLDKNEEYVTICDRSYHWTALVGTRNVFQINEIQDYPLLSRVLRKAHVPNKSDDKVYKIAFVVHRLSYTADSEQIVWCSMDKSELKDPNLLKDCVNFSFPENVEGHYTELLDEVDTYQFTHVETSGCTAYVYCLRRLDERMLPIVFCMVSNRIAYHFYDAVLNEVASRYQSDEENAYALLQALKYKPIPTEGSPVTFPLSQSRTFLYCWPSYEDRYIENIGFLCHETSVKVIVELFNAVLRSKSVVCFSQHMSKLSRCVHAISMLMYPFIWPYQLLTLVPNKLAFDFLDVPSPHLYGCLSSIVDTAKTKPLRDTLLVYLDSNTTTSYDSEGLSHHRSVFSLSDDNDESKPPELPSHLLDDFCTRLHYLKRFRLVGYNEHVSSIIASEVFLCFFVCLLEHLPDILHELEGAGDAELKSEEVRSRLLARTVNTECRQFLTDFTDTMMFSSFIESGRWKDKRSAKFFRRIAEMKKHREQWQSDNNETTKTFAFANFKHLCNSLEQFAKSIDFE